MNVKFNNQTINYPIILIPDEILKTIDGVYNIKEVGDLAGIPYPKKKNDFTKIKEFYYQEEEYKTNKYSSLFFGISAIIWIFVVAKFPNFYSVFYLLLF